MFIIDDLNGLDCAIEQSFKHTRIQKCVLHLKRNVLKRVKKTHRQAIADDLTEVFDVENKDDTLEQAFIRAKSFYQRWHKLYPHLNSFNQTEKIHYYFSYLHYDYRVRNMLYTTNWIERLNKDFKRTIKIRNSMPSVDSVLTLLSKVAIDKNHLRYQYPIYRLKLDSMFQ